MISLSYGHIPRVGNDEKERYMRTRMKKKKQETRIEKEVEEG